MFTFRSETPTWNVSLLGGDDDDNDVVVVVVVVNVKKEGKVQFTRLNAYIFLPYCLCQPENVNTG